MKQIPVYVLLIFLAFFVIAPFRADAETPSLVQAISDVQNGDYPEALVIFDDLIAKEHVLKDYLLLWRTDIAFRMGEHERAMEDIESILSEFPESPVVQEAQRKRLEIQKAWNPEERDKLLSLYENYTSRYAQDLSARYEYSQLLLDNDAEDQAFQVLVSLYREGFDFSDEAGSVPTEDQLSLEDVLERGYKLLRNWKFADAEDVYELALKKASGQIEEEIREKIALCIFRQKRYAVSAGLYEALNDRYMEAVSYLRAGNSQKFLNALEMLRSMKDPRSGALLLALASEKRKKGEKAEAILLYKTILHDYPFKEEAQWGIAWTEYLSGNYAAAQESLAAMYDQYESDKYYYWMLRSKERRTSLPLESYASLCSRDGYYAILGCIRAGSELKRVSFTREDSDAVDPDLFKRYDLLRELGMRDEALRELKALIRGVDGREDILLFSKKLQDIGEFKSSISVATRLPYNEETHDLVYPVAYWDVIEKTGKRFGVDPFYILSIAREESRLDPEARSIAGAVGLMQLMPDTATMVSRSLKRPVSDNEEFYDIETNIVLGSYYLKTLQNRFGSLILATAAYNAGGRAVERWLTEMPSSASDEFVEEIPFPETQNYVKKVLSTLYQYVRAYSGKGLDRNILLNIGRTARRTTDS